MKSITTTRIEINIGLLRRAVRKWSLISVGLGVDLAGDNCALCEYYGADCRHDWINKCPIYEDTADPGCRYTPWTDWSKHHDEIHDDSWVELDEYEGKGYENKVKCGDCRTLANKELMYLQKLLEQYKHRLNTRMLLTEE